jgi:hypothetical protein
MPQHYSSNKFFTGGGGALCMSLLPHVRSNLAMNITAQNQNWCACGILFPDARKKCILIFKFNPARSFAPTALVERERRLIPFSEVAETLDPPLNSNSQVSNAVEGALFRRCCVSDRWENLIVFLLCRPKLPCLQNRKKNKWLFICDQDCTFMYIVWWNWHITPDLCLATSWLHDLIYHLWSCSAGWRMMYFKG